MPAAAENPFMSPPVRVALIGFTPFEREHLALGLHESRAGRPAYTLAFELAGCSLAVVNADNDAAVAELQAQGRLGTCVMVGHTPRPGAGAQLQRHAEQAAMLQALDTLIGAAPAMSAAVQRVQDDLARLQRGQAPASKRRRQRLDHILVADDSDNILRFMATQLSRYGFETHLAHSGEEALRWVGQRHFEFIFLATGMDGLDGFHTCRVIKRDPYPHARARPTVVLMLPGPAPVDRVRAQMADADAWLAKPLDATELLRVVGARELQQRADAQSTRAASTLL